MDAFPFGKQIFFLAIHRYDDVNLAKNNPRPLNNIEMSESWGVERTREYSLYHA